MEFQVFVKVFQLNLKKNILVMNLLYIRLIQQKNLIGKLYIERQLMKNQLWFECLIPKNKKNPSNSKFYYWDLLRQFPNSLGLIFLFAESLLYTKPI